MRLAGAFVVLAFVAALSACGDDTEQGTVPPAAEQRQEQTRRAPATRQQERARERRAARARQRARAQRRADARQRRRQVRAQQRALDASQPENDPGDDCAEGYDPCVPPYPPDVDCEELSGPYRVSPPDPHKLDPDGNGKAC
jgi:hypothetical protein